MNEQKNLCTFRRNTLRKTLTNDISLFPWIPIEIEVVTSFLIVLKINGRPKVLIWKSTQGIQSCFSGNEIGMSRGNFCGND